MTIADDLDYAVGMVLPHMKRKLVKFTSTNELLSALANCKKEHGHFQVIAVVGHSNKNGIRLAKDRFEKWAVFAKWIEVFQPSCCVFIACEAGRWLPCRAMFEGIKSLKEVYGAPSRLKKTQVATPILLILYLLSGGRVTPKIWTWVQPLVFVLTQALLFRQTRQNFLRAGSEEGIIWTGLEELIKKLTAPVSSSE